MPVQSALLVILAHVIGNLVLLLGDSLSMVSGRQQRNAILGQNDSFFDEILDLLIVLPVIVLVYLGVLILFDRIRRDMIESSRKVPTLN